jgi:hypothetical protein
MNRKWCSFCGLNDLHWTRDCPLPAHRVPQVRCDCGSTEHLKFITGEKDGPYQDFTGYVCEKCFLDETEEYYRIWC